MVDLTPKIADERPETLLAMHRSPGCAWVPANAIRTGEYPASGTATPRVYQALTLECQYPGLR